MTSIRNRFRALAATAVAGSLALAGATAAQAAPVDYDESQYDLVNVIYFNDFHGRIEENSRSTRTVSFVSKIEELRDEHPDRDLLISGGDNIGGSLFESRATDDIFTLALLNIMEVDASAVGNHEFDRGVDDLNRRVKNRAIFPYLAANATVNGEPIADGDYIVKNVGGVRVAIVGAVTVDTMRAVNPSALEGVNITDPVESVNRVVAELKAQDRADVFIAAYHEGADINSSARDWAQSQYSLLSDALGVEGAFANIVNNTSADVDAILTAHTHQYYAAMLPGPDGELRPVLQTGQYAEAVGQVPLLVNKQTGEVTVDQTAFTVHTDAHKTPVLAGNQRVEDARALVQQAIAAAGPVGAQPAGTHSADITTAFKDAKCEAGVITGQTRDDRLSKSAMGSLVATMYRDSLSSEQRGGAQVGIVNPGGLRAELLMSETGGNLTLRDIDNVTPFANTLFTVTLAYEDLKMVLEQQWQPGKDRPFLALGTTDNLKYTYDESREHLDRITAIWLDGERMSPGDSVRVAIPSFLYAGGDGFTAFLNGTDGADSGLVDSEAFVEWAKENSPLAPDFSRRELDIQSLPEGSVKPGDEVSFTVNKINLTSLGAPCAGTIRVMYNGEQLGEAEIVDNSAEITFTVPEVGGGAGNGGAPTGLLAAWAFFMEDDAPQTAQFSLETDAGTSVPFELQVEPANQEQPTDPDTGNGDGDDTGNGDGDDSGDGNDADNGDGNDADNGDGDDSNDGDGDGSNDGGQDDGADTNQPSQSAGPSAPAPSPVAPSVSPQQDAARTASALEGIVPLMLLLAGGLLAGGAALTARREQ